MLIIFVQHIRVLKFAKADGNLSSFAGNSCPNAIMIDTVSMTKSTSFKYLSKQKEEFLKNQEYLQKHVVWEVEAKWVTEQGFSFFSSYQLLDI